jgi:hypothetical protein
LEFVCFFVLILRRERGIRIFEEFFRPGILLALSIVLLARPELAARFRQ